MLTLERENAITPALAPLALQALLRSRARAPGAGPVGLAAEAADVVTPAEGGMAADTRIAPQVLRWMPVAVPMAAVLLCASIALIWTQL